MADNVAHFCNSWKRFQYRYNLKLFSILVKKCIRLKVRGVMTKDVVSVDSDMSLLKASNLMREGNISSLVVRDRGVPVGILTEQDFVRKLGKESTVVADIFSEGLISISHDKTIFDASKMLLENHIRKLVVKHRGKMVGIVTQTDLVRALSYFGRKALIDSIDVPDVREGMSADVICVERSSSLDEARRIMAEHKIGCLCIRGNKLGIITERDIVSEYSKDPGRLEKFCVINSMTCPASTIDHKENVFRANILMLDRGFRRLPVLTGGKLAGIVTQTDVMREMYGFIERSLDRIRRGDYLAVDVERVR